MSEVYPEHVPHDNAYIEDEHFAEVFAQDLIRSEIVPDGVLCERLLKNNFVNEYELELILEAYERYTDVRTE